MAGKKYISRSNLVPPVVTSDLRFELIWPTVPQKIQWINVDHDQLGTSTTSTYMGQYTDQWGEHHSCVDDGPSEVSCFPVHSWGSRVAGRLGIMGSGGSSQARFLHGKPSHQTGNCFGFILPVQVSFVFTGWGAVSSFKFSLQPEVSTCWTLLMAWLWEFPWEDDMMTWLFCKLPQVNQVETAKCRDLRLSKSRWEHLGTVVARFVACGMICLTPLAPRFDCLRLKTCAPKPPLLHRKEVVVPVTEWRQYEMLLFDSCLIPVVWFPIHVGRFPNHPFLHSEASLVSQRRSRAALVFAKCIHVLLLHFLREWYYADHPGARCLGSLTQNMLTFLDIYNPEAVWMTGAHSVKWQRPGSWEAQEIRRQRRRRVVLFEVSSSCTTSSFVAPKFSGRKVVWFGGSCHRTWTWPFSFQPAQRAFGKKALPQHNIVREIPQSIWEQRRRFQT